MVGALKDILSEIIVALATALILLVPRKLFDRLRRRSIRKFWSSYIGKPVNIVITEYNLPDNNSLPANIARSAGLGTLLITRCMGSAMTHMMNFCSRYISKPEDVKVTGGNEGLVEDNLIILGTPLANRVSEAIFTDIANHFDVPWNFRWNSNTRKIEIYNSNISCSLSANLNADTCGDDYTLIIKAPCDRNCKKWAVIIGACLMFGTEEGAKAITNPKILDEVCKKTKGAEGVAFIIKTRIINGRSRGSELMEVYIQPLIRRNTSSNPSGLPATNVQ